MPSNASRARSRIGFAAFTLVLFAGSFAGAYALRQRQNETVTALPIDTSVASETTVVADTTTPLVVDSSVAETTIPVDTAVESETSAAPATSPLKPKFDLPLTTDGSAFRTSSERALWDDTLGCDSLANPNSTAKDCDRLNIADMGVAWVLDAAGGATVFVSDPSVDEAGTWNARLATDRSPSGRPVVTDVTGDGQPELVFGFRTDTRLAIDVVELRNGSPSVVLHLNLVGGRVSAGDGQLDVWQGMAGSFEHWSIIRQDGRWTKDGFERTPSAPAGDL